MILPIAFLLFSTVILPISISALGALSELQLIKGVLQLMKIHLRWLAQRREEVLGILDLSCRGLGRGMCWGQ
jgi:hypothetical protein